MKKYGKDVQIFEKVCYNVGNTFDSAQRVRRERRKDLQTMKINLKTHPAKRFAAVLLTVLVLAAAFCLPVSAETAKAATYTIPDTGMTITLSEGVLILAQDTPSNDAAWAEAGILDVGEKLAELNQDGILAEIRAFDNTCVIAVSAKTSDYSQALFNLNNLTDEQKQDFLDRMQPTSADERTGGTITWYEHEQIPFFCIDIHSMAVDEAGAVYERLYGTLYNGMIVSFDLYNGTEEISAEYDALMREIVDSAVIAEFQEAPSHELTSEALWLLIVLVLLIVMLIGFFVYRSVSNKREKREKSVMADHLAAYRQKKDGHEDEGDGALRFVNETEHSDNAIKVFANFHAYRRHIMTPIFTVVIGLIALYVVWQSGSSDNWWMILLLLACVVFCVYKIATAGTTITKNMMRSYGKLRSRKAAYYFYEGDFRITGLQASNLHPYFQITCLYETKEYFYMYFGEDNTYFIKKDGFKQGDVDSFRAFMKEKLGKRFK